MGCPALELAGRWVELGLSVEMEISGKAVTDWYYEGPGGLWWSSVLNSALLPQRLRPDTCPEHQDPVSHTGVGPGSCASHHSASSCLHASLPFSLIFTSHTGWGMEGSAEDASRQLPHHVLVYTTRRACRVLPSHRAGSAKTARPPDRPTDPVRREGYLLFLTDVFYSQCHKMWLFIISHEFILSPGLDYKFRETTSHIYLGFNYPQHIVLGT